VLVTGIAGSGKSTTLAALIQYMNLNAERHVITLEDPIEILFSEKRCVISQREVGIDCPPSTRACATPCARART
jgi:twitching motility protein PilT